MSLNALRRVLSHSGWSAAALHANELLSGVLSVRLQCHFCILSVSVAKSPVLRMLSLRLLHSLGSL